MPSLLEVSGWRCLRFGKASFAAEMKLCRVCVKRMKMCRHHIQTGGGAHKTEA